MEETVGKAIHVQERNYNTEPAITAAVKDYGGAAGGAQDILHTTLQK